MAAARVDNPAATTRDLGIYLNNHLSIERWRLALGLRRDAVSTDNGRLFVTLAAFDIEIGNLSNPNALPNALPNANSQQEGFSKLDGVELEARLLLGDVSLELNASRIDTRDPNGRRFASVPERQASAWLSWRPQGVLQGLRGGVGVRYTGRSFDGADTLVTPSTTLGGACFPPKCASKNA